MRLGRETSEAAQLDPNANYVQTLFASWRPSLIRLLPLYEKLVHKHWVNCFYQVAAMVLISRFKEIKSRDLYGVDDFIPQLSNNLNNCLLDLLGCSDPAFPTNDSLLPCAELSRTYSKMRNESSAMLNNKRLTTKMDPKSLSADDAWSFASRFPLLNDTIGVESEGRDIVDENRIAETRAFNDCSLFEMWSGLRADRSE